jgi:hypothetical protein
MAHIRDCFALKRAAALSPPLAARRDLFLVDLLALKAGRK